ncbi:RNA polymerase sigma factor [Pontibacter sp. MBLB2868]|uniref:RNA polymerase sigma factor n=1 Tax=Pontibacter sp. MBLB2868 TaxID=3451555 RepID=UPI003F754E04
MPIQSSNSEKDLVDRLQSGDQAAVYIVYDKYSSVLYGVILRIVKCEKRAEDVLQDCFEKFWKSVGSYDLSKTSLYTWLLSIARNAALDALRYNLSRKNRNSFKINSYKPDCPDATSTQFNTNHPGVKQLTHLLSPMQKEIIDLLYFEGFTHAEAAEKLYISLGTLKNESKNAFAKLKRHFASHN